MLSQIDLLLINSITSFKFYQYDVYKLHDYVYYDEYCDQIPTIELLVTLLILVKATSINNTINKLCDDYKYDIYILFEW